MFLVLHLLVALLHQIEFIYLITNYPMLKNTPLCLRMLVHIINLCIHVIGISLCYLACMDSQDCIVAVHNNHGYTINVHGCNWIQFVSLRSSDICLPSTCCNKSCKHAHTHTHTHNVCYTASGPHLGSEPLGGNKTGDPVARLVSPTA